MKVYWNNICLISRFEKQYIENKLREEGLEKNYEFEFFGINKEKEIINSVEKDLEQEELPDIIVATESDLFHSKEGFLGKENLFDKFTLWPFREQLPHVCPKEKFGIMLYIPLVMIVNKKEVEKIPESIEEVLANPRYEGQITFGGLDNAAGKTLLMTIAYLYGEEKSNQLLKWSKVTSMPVGAFKNVTEGRSLIGFVPTIFAMRAEVTGIVQVWPKEGAVVIPSFVAVRKGADLKKAEVLFQKVITIDFIQQISQQAGVIPCLKGTETVDMFKGYETQLIYPSWEFIRNRKEEKRGEIND